ncbi:MAG: hypothetical protein MSA57_08970 [Ruminococcus sp.]|nr:hypothetical protein [Ruminococcus sp.]
MKFLKKGLAVLFACTFISVPLYHPVKADAVSMDDMGDMNEDQEVSVSDAVEILTIYAKSAAGQSPSVTERKRFVADVNYDAQITVEDAVYVLTYYAKTAAGLSPSWESLGISMPQRCPEIASHKRTYTTKTETGNLVNVSFLDIDDDGEKETIAKYKVDGQYDHSYFYNVYEQDGSVNTYEGRSWNSSKTSLITLVYDKNIGKKYLANIERFFKYWNGQGLSLIRYDGKQVASYYTLNTNNGYGGYSYPIPVELNTSTEFTISGNLVTLEEARNYFENIEILDLDERNLANWYYNYLKNYNEYIETVYLKNPDKWASSLDGYNAWDLMFISRSNFIAGVNGDYSETGQWAETKLYGIKSPMFPGYIIDYPGEYPDVIRVDSGEITDSTWVGMSYSELVSALGKPDGYGLMQIDGNFPSASYNIDGRGIAFYFYDVIADLETLDPREAAKKCLEEKNPSVTHAQISNGLWNF